MDPNEPFDQPVPMTPEPSGAPPKGGRRWQWFAAAGAAVLVIGAAFVGMQVSKSDSSGSSTTADPNASSASSASAAPRPGRVPGARGTIKSIDGSTLAVETSDNKTVTVTTSDKTTVTQTDDGSVSDIAEGDHLLVMGTSSGSQTEAQRIVDTGSQDIGNGFGRGGAPGSGSIPGNGSGGAGQNPPNGFPSNGPNGGGFTPPVIGTVTQVADGTITLKTSQGDTVTVTTTSSTTVTVRRTAKVSDLDEGDTILVIGKTSGNTIAATSISKGDAGGLGPGGGGFPGGGNFPGGPPGGSGGNDASNPAT